MGGRYPGLYTVAGTYNGRGDYYSEAQEYNIFFEPTSAAQAGSDAGDDDSDGDDDDSDDDDDKRRRRRRMLNGKAVGKGRKEERKGEAARVRLSTAPYGQLFVLPLWPI